MQRKDYWIGFATGAAAVALGALLGVTVNQVQHVSRGYVMSDPSHMARLESLEDLIDEYYLGETDDKALADGVYKGLISGLGDRYSCYYTAEEYKAESADSEGTYEGIGTLLQSLSDGTVLIVECYDGGSGKEAGLQAGDVIIRLDGNDVTGMTLAEVADYIRNAGVNNVSITVLRGKGDQKETLEFSVPVMNVELPSVFQEMLEEKTGYLRIIEFKGVTYHQFCDALDALRSEGMEKLVIDLRDNPGGHVDIVCDILRKILPKGLIVYTEDKHGAREEEYCEGESPIDIPLAVLVNGGSASASEIFAGAIKDYGTGTIVGTTTYGKGIVQSIRAYPDGSAVKLTTSHYFTPAGHDIHEIGIEPDVVVEDSEDDTDTQLLKALEIVRAEAAV